MNATGKKLKKQSDADYGSKPPESITFFPGRALGKHAVAKRPIQEGKELKETEIKVKHLEDFPDFKIPPAKNGKSSPVKNHLWFWLKTSGFATGPQKNYGQKTWCESVCFDQGKLDRGTDG